MGESDGTAATYATLEAINTVFREALASETEEQLARTSLAVAEQLTTSRFGFIGELNATCGWIECCE